MSYRKAKTNPVTSIYLVFDEIEISKSNLLYKNWAEGESHKMRRHENGADNKDPSQVGGWLDPNTNDDPLIIPAYDHELGVGKVADRQIILQNVKKYFEVFDVNVEISNKIPEDYPIIARYVKLLPPGLRPVWIAPLDANPPITVGNLTHPQTINFNKLPDKFRAYKRMVWNQEIKGVTMFDCAITWHNFAWVGHSAIADSQSDLDAAQPETRTKLLYVFIQGIVHEIGHLYGLDHQADDRFLLNDYYNLDYIRTDWSPIMGKAEEVNLSQWSNTDYKHAIVSYYYGDTRSQATPRNHKGGYYDYSRKRRTFPYVNEVLTMINNGMKLKKHPGKNFKITFAGPSRGASKINTTKDNLFARYMTSSDTRNIVGMIGYEKDYDIIKILLPKGTYTFEVEPYNVDHENVSMLKPRLEILYCQAEPKSPSFVSEDLLPDIWIPEEGAIAAKKNKNIFHKVVIEND